MSSSEPSLAFTALLAHWTQVAQAALVLTDEQSGPQWRRSLEPMITLHALASTLDVLGDVSTDERPHARERATLMIDHASDQLDEIWERDDQFPQVVSEVLEMALTALAKSHYAGLQELWWKGAKRLTMPQIDPEFVGPPHDVGSVAVMRPGTIVLPGEPVAWWVDRDEPYLQALLPECEVVAARRPHQVYRAWDTDHRWVGDTVADMESTLEGLPLLIPLIAWGNQMEGVPFGSDHDAWYELQHRSMGSDIPVTYETDDE